MSSFMSVLDAPKAPPKTFKIKVPGARPDRVGRNGKKISADVTVTVVTERLPDAPYHTYTCTIDGEEGVLLHRLSYPSALDLAEAIKKRDVAARST